MPSGIKRAAPRCRPNDQSVQLGIPIAERRLQCNAPEGHGSICLEGQWPGALVRETARERGPDTRNSKARLRPQISQNRGLRHREQVGLLPITIRDLLRAALWYRSDHLLVCEVRCDGPLSGP
jgi:hypothetical protein